MPRMMRIPGADNYGGAGADLGTSSCQWLIIRMLHRALVDAIGGHAVEYHYKRDAIAWLFNDSGAEYTAQWWAKEASLEHILESCRRILKDKSGFGRRFYGSIRTPVFRCRIGYAVRPYRTRRSRGVQPV